MTESSRIVAWNEERNLIKTPADVNISKELSFIVEECIEAIVDIDSEDCRSIAQQITDSIMAHSDGKLDAERIVDAMCDIKVFATGLIRKLGYNPDIAMDEVQQEIDSRKGSIIDGKFTKDKSIKAVENWYTADFTKAKI